MAVSDEKITAAEAAQALGLEVRKRRWGPCPACSTRTDSHRRGALVCNGPRWFCSKCGVKGDGVTLISYVLTGEPRSYREAFAWLEDRKPALAQLPPIEEEVRQRIPLRDLVELMRACLPAKDCHDGDYFDYCERKGVEPSAAPGGILPPVGHPVYARTRAWWPGHRSQTWRIVLPMFDSSGQLAGMHVRATTSTATPKARWPIGVDCRGLFFANEAGRRFLRGELTPTEVLICEGFSDSFYAMSLPAPAGRAILGVESGSPEALRLVRFHVDTPVYCATHPDEKGDQYAEKIVANVLPATTYRIPLMRA